MIVISMILIKTITISRIAIETVGEQIHSHPKGPIFSIYYVLLNSNCTCFTCKNKKKEMELQIHLACLTVPNPDCFVLASCVHVVGSTWQHNRPNCLKVNKMKYQFSQIFVKLTNPSTLFQKLLNTDNHKTQSINQNLDSFLVQFDNYDGI